MHDQADELRQRFRSVKPTSKPRRAPKIIAFSGGSSEVGTTTVTVNVAISWAQQGRRVVLVDADDRAADATTMCGLNDEHGSLHDVLCGDRDIHETMQCGSGSVLVVPGDARSDVPDHGPQRLIDQCRGLELYADAVLVDLGSRDDDLARFLWQAADLVAVVTLDSVQSITDSYAAIKTLCGGDQARVIQTVLNQADRDAALQAHSRLHETARRFLGLSTRLAGEVPLDSELRRSALPQRPIVLQSPRSQTARSMERVGEMLWVSAVSCMSWSDQRGAASEDFAPAAGYGPLAA